MERVFDRVVGLDVHKDTVVACVRLPRGEGGRTAETATFGTTTADLLGLRDWLAAHQVQVVGMESTGVYWKPVFYLLGARNPGQPPRRCRWPARRPRAPRPTRPAPPG